MRKFLSFVCLYLLICVPTLADTTINQLQDISVNIKANDVQGSGVLTNVGGTCYVITAGHVVNHLRKAREVTDPKTGTARKEILYDDAEVVKLLIENGRTVGQMNFFAEVIRCSNPDNGDDLAILRVRKKNLSNNTVKFYLDEKIPDLGTPLYHVGSLLGIEGYNSLTSGIMSQTGRLIDGKEYDQTTCTAFPGSSGGGVYTQNGLYIGTLVRGAGEGFNLIVPMRRVMSWAKKVGMDFVFDTKLPIPKEEVIKKVPIEDVGTLVSINLFSKILKYPFLVRSK